MRANTKSRQTTINVDGQKIVVKSRLRTRQANPVGFRVWINGEQSDWFTPDRQEAEGKALDRWIDKNDAAIKNRLVRD